MFNVLQLRDLVRKDIIELVLATDMKQVRPKDRGEAQPEA